MKVFYGFDGLPLFKKPIVTIGSYDGVHAGHRVLLRKVMDVAEKQEGESVVITFSPHPREILGQGVELLNTIEEKIFLLDEAGIDNLVVVPFSKEFSCVSSDEFVRDYLVAKIGVRGLVVGYNHHFGKNKQGNFDSLELLGREYGFEVYKQERADVGDNKVSSTIIRQVVKQGDMSLAGEYLSRPYIVYGRYAGRGTVCLLEESKLLPASGVYSVEVRGRMRELTVTSARKLQLDYYDDFESGEQLMISFC